jgi:hypothetical protein
VIALNLGAAGIACGTENSDCAGSTRDWRGRVYGRNGAPARAATVLYVFASNQPRGEPLGRELALPVDRSGRYCLRWPTEKVTAAIRASGVIAAGQPDPRLAALALRAPGPIIVTPDAAGRQVTPTPPPGTNRLGVLVVAQPWDPATDATSDCIERSPPWYRRDDLLLDWHSLLLFGLAVLALILGNASLNRRKANPVPLGRGGAGAGSVALILFVLFWITKSL